MKFDNYVNKPIPVGKKDGIYKIIKLGSRETGYYEMTLKDAVDQFNVGRGIDAGNGWCGWNDQDPENPKKKCDCTTTLRTVEEIEFDETDTFGNRMTWTEKVIHCLIHDLATPTATAGHRTDTARQLDTTLNSKLTTTLGRSTALRWIERWGECGP
jgi:hypothetical protein